MVPNLNKNKSKGVEFNPKLLIVLVFFASFSIIEASAQVVSGSDIFTLRVKSEPNILFISGGGEYKAGTTVTIDPAPETFEDYTFVGWQIDGRWAEGNPITIRMDNSHSALAVYSKDKVGNIVIDTIPKVSEITVDGTIYLPDELPLSFSWVEGSTHIISTPAIIKSSPETRYVFDSWKDKNKESDRTITVDSETKEFIVLYKTEHFLKPITEYGTVIGGGWQEAGKTATFELESDIVLDKKDDNIRYVFDSWDFGDYINSPANSVDLTEPVTVKAKWTPQFKLDVKTSIPDYVLFGSGWYEEGKQVALIAEEELESPNSDIRYVFDRWISRGPNPVLIPNAQEPSTTIAVDQPYVVEATYKESYRVNVWSPFGNPIGSGFYTDSEIAEITLPENEIVVSPNKEKKIFVGWNTYGARTMTPELGAEEDTKNIGNQNLLVLVDHPLNVTANWKSMYYVDVQTPYLKATGSGWYELGQLVPIAIQQRSTPPGMWSSNTFSGWSGDISGDNINARVIVNGPKSIVAEWKEDNTPGIINGIILAGIGGVAAVVYKKTHFNLKNNKEHNGTQKLSFDKFFSMKKPAAPAEDTPAFYTQKKKSVVDWLLDRD